MRTDTSGLIARLQQRIDADPRLQQSMIEDHDAYIAQSASITFPGMFAQLQALGITEILASRGVGGIADFSRIRCPHTRYAAHLVVPDMLGKLLDEHSRLID